MTSSPAHPPDAGDADGTADSTGSDLDDYRNERRKEPEAPRGPGAVLRHRTPEKGTVRINTEHAELAVSVLAPGLLRLRYGAGELGTSIPATPAIDPAFEEHPGEMELDERAPGLLFRTPDLRLDVEDERLSLRLSDADGRTITEDRFGLGVPAGDGPEEGSERPTLILERRLPSGVRLFGLGGAGGRPDRRGRILEAGEVDVPLLISRHGDEHLSHGLLVAGAERLRWELDPEEENRLRVVSHDPELTLYLLHGPKPEDVYARLADLTGHHPMPPQWALGLRRSTVETGDEELERRTHRASRHAALPIDGIHRPEPLTTRPDASSEAHSDFVEALASGRLHLTVPLTREERSPRSEPPDEPVRTQIERGADGFHLTDRFAPAEEARSVFHACRRAESVRPMLTTPGTGPGGHRYAGTWLGRPIEGEADLIDRIRRCLSLSASGQVMVGFNPHPRDPSRHQLLLDALRAAIAMPLLWTAPTSGDDLLGLAGCSEPTIRAYRRALHLRYKILPYLYGLFDRHRRTGAPIVRPPGLAPRGLEESLLPPSGADETRPTFFLGTDLLVAPARRFGDGDPEGSPIGHGWHDLQSARPLEAPDCSGSEIPIYVRAGTVLPLRPLSRHSRPRPSSPIVLRYYPGPNRRTTFYLDDGISYAYRTGRHRRLEIETSGDEDLRIAIAHTGRFPIERPAIEWQIPRRNWKTVRVDGDPIDTTKNPELFVRDTNHAYRGRTYLRIRTRPEVRSLHLVPA